MDLFAVNIIEEEKILHHKIKPADGSDSYVSQGDILFRPGEETKLFGTANSTLDESENSKNVLNDGLSSLIYRWPKVIPYTVASNLDSSVRKGIDEIEEKTCIRFKKRDLEVDYLRFINDYGCYSFVGRRGGAQIVSIGYACDCKRTVTHEIMHALGFYHEQARPDRDEYVNILYENVKPGLRSNFDKITAESLSYFGTKYDYNSIMHYKKNEFSILPSINTIEAKDNKDRVLGKVKCDDGLSETDAIQLNRMYCSAATEEPVITSNKVPILTLPPMTENSIKPTTERHTQSPTTTTTQSTTKITRSPRTTRRPTYNFYDWFSFLRLLRLFG